MRKDGFVRLVLAFRHAPMRDLFRQYCSHVGLKAAQVRSSLSAISSRPTTLQPRPGSRTTTSSMLWCREEEEEDVGRDEGLGVPSPHLGCHLWSSWFLAVLRGVKCCLRCSLVSRGYLTCVSLRGLLVGFVVSPCTAYFYCGFLGVRLGGYMSMCLSTEASWLRSL